MPEPLRILLFGATGMVGQGALRECLADPRVARVLSVGRKPIGRQHPKLGEIVLGDLALIDTIAGQLKDLDACLFCIGVTSAGLSEQAYSRISYDLTLRIAALLARLNPGMTFIYVSGAGTDSTERGRFMWARVKGRTENDLRRLPFKATYMFRPGAIQPLHGIRSKTGWYRALYALTRPLYPLLRRLFPGAVTTTELVGRAMVEVAYAGFDKPILETPDINRMGGEAAR
jgi:uncharacterized protein YbjT (DUF2867 family)